MANKHMKKYVISIKKMQIKSMMKYNCISSRMPQTKTENINVLEDVQKLEL